MTEHSKSIRGATFPRLVGPNLTHDNVLIMRLTHMARQSRFDQARRAATGSHKTI
jgi:hypothetical protein